MKFSWIILTEDWDGFEKESAKENETVFEEMERREREEKEKEERKKVLTVEELEHTVRDYGRIGIN